MNTPLDLTAAREFAVDVVRKLRAAGYDALWAGGCVRDQLLRRTPKDYDVATNARPEQIREVFGKRRSLPIGAAFGVITVLGPPGSGQIEVATFRSDAEYSDGRHPDGVEFTDAKHDAMRRDFTINGLFYDPLSDELIDYVGGQADLEARRIRAIGNPRDRIGEDKLRMLRAVRFTATFGFSLDEGTAEAIRETAATIVVVSAERIAQELRRMLVHESRRYAAELLCETELLGEVFPELSHVARSSSEWEQTLSLVDAMHPPAFACTFAALFYFTLDTQHERLEVAERIGVRLRLTTAERRTMLHALTYEEEIRSASARPWPEIQRILAAPRSAELFAFASAVDRLVGGDGRSIPFCRDKLALPPDELNPPPILTGDDLRADGLAPGPAFREVLDSVRDLQLTNQLHDKEGALGWLKAHRPELWK